MGLGKASATRIPRISILFLICFFVSTSARSQEVVHWAGVGFLGEYAERQNLYPNSAEAYDAQCGDVSCVEKAARAVLLAKDFENIVISPELAEPNQDAVAVAIGISYERVRSQRFFDNKSNANAVLVNYTLYASLLFFNLDTNQLLSAVPVYLRYAEVRPENPDEAEAQKVFADMLGARHFELNIFEEIYRRAKTIRINKTGQKYVQIAEVSVSDSAWSEVRSEALSQGPWLTQIAQVFESSLIDKTGAAMIPSAVGHVVGGKLKIRLQSGDRTITLPEPDFKFTLNISGFKRFEKPAKHNRTVCFGTKIDLTLSDAFGDEVLADSLRSVPCSLLGLEVVLDDSAEYEKALLNLLADISEAFSDPSKSTKFFKSASPKSEKALQRQFTSAKQLALTNSL